MVPEFTLHDLLANSVERDPEKVSIVDGEHRYRYADLGRQAQALALTLVEAGLRPGDRVGVYLDKSWEAGVAVFAVSQAGGVFVNINSLLRERQVRHVVEDAGIAVLLTSSAKVSGMALPAVSTLFYLGTGNGDGDGEEPPQLGSVTRWVSLADALARPAEPLPLHGVTVTETDLATILYTSGSTGLPKGIIWSQRNLVVGAQIVTTYLNNTADDRVLSLLPLSFDYGLNQLTTMVRVGGTLVLQRSSMAGAILQSLRKERITGLAGVPPVWVLLLQNRHALRTEPLEALRYLTNSGGFVPLEHVRELRELLPSTRIYLMYGLTEAFRSTYLPPEELDRRPTSIGIPIPNTEIWVLDEGDRSCPPGQVGELVHRGPTVALGYWGDPEATARVYRPNPFLPPQAQGAERVVYSGDLVRQDDAGFLYYVGRRDDQIKTEGYRISPQEIESLLYMLPAVKEAVAFGIPEPTVGQRIVVVVSLKAGAGTEGGGCTEEEIRRHFRLNAPPYMMPRLIEFRNELPKTATGKIDRPALIAQYVPE